MRKPLSTNWWTVGLGLGGLAPAGDQVAGGGRPFGEKKLEAGGEQAAGHDAAAFEDEFGFRAHEEGTDLDEPCGRRQREARAPRFAKGPHEIGIA